MRLHSAIRGIVAPALFGVFAVACSGGDDDSVPGCLPQAASTDCTLLYAPTFDNVWKNTLKLTCAATDCHTGGQPTGNMALDDEDLAYANLLSSSADRVRPNDVRCGKVIVRLHSAGKPYTMPPPPATLRTGEACSITQWIAMGARR